MRAKKIIGWTATALFFCAFVTMVVLVGINWDKITSGTTLYTVSDLKEEYNKGVNAGLEQGEEWRVLYEKVLADLSDAEENQSILTARLNSERANNEQLESEKAVLTVELSQTKEELATALLQNETDADTISQLQARVSELELQLEEKELVLATSNETIASLEADKLALQNEVTRLTALLAGYEEIANSTLTADFYIGDTLYTTKVVKSGQAVAGLENPVDTNDYRFDGWTIDGTTPVDVASYELEENTVFRALLTEKHEVRFVANGEVVSTQYIVDGEVASAVEDPTLEGGEFRGWYLDDPSVYVDVSTIAIESDITLTAYFATWQTAMAENTTLKNNGKLTVDGIKTTDKIRVTFDRVLFSYGVGLSLYIFESNDGEFVAPSISANIAATFMLDVYENFEPVFYYEAMEVTFTISIKFVCSEDGALSLSATAKSSKDTIAMSASFKSLRIKTVEVFK